MPQRTKLLLLALAATLTVVLGAVALASRPAAPQAGCSLVLVFSPYPHYVSWCNPGGGAGGSW